MFKKNQSTATAYLFLAPFLISTLVFFVYAFGRAIYYSFTDFNLFNVPHLIGLKPYADVLNDVLFRRALANTLIFAVTVTTLQTILSLLMAVALNNKIRGMGFFRSAWYMPSITSSVVITLIFLWLFQRRGVANYVITQFQMYQPFILAFVGILVVAQIAQVLFERSRQLPAGWFDPALAAISALLAIAAIVVLSFTGVLQVREVPAFDFQYFADVWLSIGGVQVLSIPLLVIIIQNTFTTIPTLMLFFLAGLQNIPGSLYEAADIDGATPFEKLMNVTVPMLRPVTFYVITVGLIGTMQMFDQVAVIGDAAPQSTLITLAYYVYINTFKAGTAPVNMAAAGAIILAMIILVMVFIQRKFFPSEASV
ncbi:sugar ABC transporter permease (plasmid) [Deinococcus psychrotolerans]|uniref:Sugar ABC transporter permease n=1 Tax=Deinococcus psychrotolerans TaxID=2489213 RepID=A0A3G8YS74_9DEIO|nr:sugar ABC transporter permease [Deinococcus psychrotolerans]AZI44601.1 sugar ABC transporter permease [Deinococcus psychrotolerans]